MRDFKDATSSATVIKLLEIEVARAQERLRLTTHDSPQMKQIVEEAQANIDRIVAVGFTGKTELPKTFVVDGVQHTPQSYAKHLQITPDDYITIEASERLRPGWRSWGGDAHRVNSYNLVNVDHLLTAMKSSIDHGRKFYIGLPVGDASAPFMMPSQSNVVPGTMSLSAFDYKTLGLPEPITDRKVIQAHGLHPANHAMTGTAYDQPGDMTEPLKWQLDNTWGVKAGDEGRQHAYTDFVRAFVGHVSVHRSVLDPALLKRIESEFQAGKQINWLPK
jgi:hypothetical protein